MKTDNFDNLDELILKFKQKCFRESFLSSFPNIIVLIKIYLTSPIANVTSERGSCLKRVKTYLRSTMDQSRLSSLGILNFENHMLDLIDLDEAIKEFAASQDRQLSFH